ncbi:CYTH domain-containing protein [Alloyangia pacifica]|uniref:CYTH domain-containing protein n=1 Tax=Alloyangia pacifica TaxID=311180 RepID=UPI001CFCFE76|nr:CYTH domain-containing protein [Alloyangia pacifica]
MAKEIERKFLVGDDTWKQRVVRSELLRDGLVATENGRKVRVRFYDERATLSLKGPRNGLVRDEFEYPIPAADAQDMLDNHCTEVVEKRRHYILENGLEWTVDVYTGLLEGIVIAEVELTCADQALSLPDWIGPEVTGHQEYRKINMIRARRGEAGQTVRLA